MGEFAVLELHADGSDLGSSQVAEWCDTADEAIGRAALRNAACGDCSHPESELVGREWEWVG